LGGGFNFGCHSGARGARTRNLAPIISGFRVHRFATPRNDGIN
jgi:hypothetical protein